ncbi:hypothetical protein D3C86_1766950 [compost metagenome]
MAASQIFHGDFFRVAAFDIGLHGAHHLVGVSLLAHEHRERQLTLAAPVQLEILGAPDGGVAVGVFFDQVQHQMRR